MSVVMILITSTRFPGIRDLGGEEVRGNGEE